MKSSLCFLLAAKRCEMADLQHLTQTSEWVRVIAALIHELQRERGLSNLYVGSNGARFSEPRVYQLSMTDAAEQELRARFDALDIWSTRFGTRLFSRIADALHGLDALQALRHSVLNLRRTPRQLSADYERVIANLLAVVFEAADSASDLALTQLLVALFNFMQGKEFAGQERATGAAMLASGAASSDDQQQMLHLIDSQDRCLQVFQSFASEQVVQMWEEVQDRQVLMELERLRRQLCNAAPGGQLDEEKSLQWFECCSVRMDEMRRVEEQLTQQLVVRCQARLAMVESECQQIERFKQGLLSGPGAAREATPPDYFERVSTARVTAHQSVAGSALERSVFDLVQEQSLRIQAMSAELDAVKASLSERKLIERAKGLLMAHQKLTEDGAHKALRDLAMRQNKRMVDVAEAVLAMSSLLAPGQ